MGIGPALNPVTVPAGQSSVKGQDVGPAGAEGALTAALWSAGVPCVGSLPTGQVKIRAMAGRYTYTAGGAGDVSFAYPNNASFPGGVLAVVVTGTSAELSTNVGAHRANTFSVYFPAAGTFTFTMIAVGF